MSDTDQLVHDCQQALADPEPRLAVKDVLTRAVHDRALVEVLQQDRGGLFPLYTSPELSVVNVIWAPGMGFRPHNHLMWSAIGLYGGQEDNIYYRRAGHGIMPSGNRELRAGEVALHGDDTIHAVTNPHRTFTGAIHVYDGDIVSRPGRSEWDEDTGKEVPYEFERLRRYFETFENVDT